MNLKVLIFFFPLLLAAAPADFYVWQRKHTPEVKSAVAEFMKYSSGKLFFVAGELENDGRRVLISPPQIIEVFHKRIAPVIRIHVKNLKNSPDILAEHIIAIYTPWKKCRSLQIDLDAPERKMEYYTALMQVLKKKLPGVKLSATVLPCHVRHYKKFSELANSCDYFVLQIHGLEKRNGKYSILDRNIALNAISNAIKIRHPLKIALPLYSHKIGGATIKPDLELVKNIARFAVQNNIDLIGFRLGVDGDGEALALPTAQSICRGEKYSPYIRHYWQRTGDGAWHLYIENNGYFSERVELSLNWQNSFDISDADTLSEAELSFDRRTLSLILPADRKAKPYLWLRCTGNFDLNNNNILTITGKDISCK